MTDSLFSDSAMRTARSALDGLSIRQQIISRNLANIDTPGYHAQTINFEETLQHLMNNSGSLPIRLTNVAHMLSSEQNANFTIEMRPGGTERADQNNVDVDTELIEMSEAGIQYQAVSQAVSQKLILLKSLAK